MSSCPALPLGHWGHLVVLCLSHRPGVNRPPGPAVPGHTCLATALLKWAPGTSGLDSFCMPGPQPWLECTQGIVSCSSLHTRTLHSRSCACSSVLSTSAHLLTSLHTCTPETGFLLVWQCWTSSGLHNLVKFSVIL